MKKPTGLCLNMIVKNEAAIIERCLSAVADHIDCWVIADTGSTDDTKEKVRAFFDAKGIPGEVVEFPFEDFSQARNGALEAAEASSLAFDYLLLVDADMELVVQPDHSWRGLGADVYNVIQKAGSSLEYENARLVKRGCGARYKSRTHEYLSSPTTPAKLKTIWFRDHACGSNRPNKIERDIALLLKDAAEDENNPRPYFYLGQSYFEVGKFEESQTCYDKRVAMGGWDEEVWYSSMMSAVCSEKLGKEDEFVAKMLAAYQMRPHRAETLYRLAVYYMAKGKTHIAAMIAEEGLTIPYPEQDILFIDASVYRHGFIGIFSIAGFYNPTKRHRASEANNWLCLSPVTPTGARNSANMNVQHYLRPLGEYITTWKSQRIPFDPAEGWNAMNPSVCRFGDDLLVNVRNVNYKVDFRQDGAHYVTQNGAPITTKNFIVTLRKNGDTFEQASVAEVLAPLDMPFPKYSGIIGFEDLRLCVYDGSVWVNGTVCELTPDGDRQMARARLAHDGRNYRMTDWSVIKPTGLPVQAEKNWMPFVDAEHGLSYVYSLGPTRTVDWKGDTTRLNTPKVHANGFRGGSQVVPFVNGCSLCVIHEVTWHRGENRRIYYHRFVEFDEDCNITRVSPAFVFNKVRFEFAAGLALDGDNIIVTYGVDDCEAHIGTVSVEDVAEFLQPVTAFA